MRFRKAHAIVLWGALAGWIGPAPVGGEVTLVADGVPKAAIVLPDRPSRAAAEAAKVLREHVKAVSGAELKILHEKDLVPVEIAEGTIRALGGRVGDEVYVLIGLGALARRLGLTAEGLGPGGIVACTTKNAVVLFGRDDEASDPWGTHYAVTTFLERALGVRYLWPGRTGLVVPRRATLRVGKLALRHTPLLRQRHIRSARYNDRVQVGLDRLGVTKTEYQARRAEATATGLAGANWFRWHRMGGTLGLRSGHAFGHLWRKYGKSHPEWFARQPNGSRDQGLAPTRPRLCISNAALLAKIAEEKIRELTGPPPRTSASIGPNDGGQTTFCMCEACKKLDAPSGRKIRLRWSEMVAGRRKIHWFEYVSLSDRMAWFYNEIARRVAKAHPNALLVADAYSAYSDPPLRTKLRANIVVRIVRIDYGSDEQRRAGLAAWDGWAKAARKIYFRPNLLLARRRQATLMLFPHKMAEDFRYLAHHRMLGTDFDSCMHNWATQGLNYYVLARLHWDPDLDVDKVIDEYCASGFGPAAKAVKQYFRRVEAVTNEFAAVPAKDRHAMEHLWRFTPEVVAGLRKLLADAKKRAADDEAVRKRIAFLEVGLDWTQVQVQVWRKYDALWPKIRRRTATREEIQGAHRILDRKYRLMRDILRDHPMAVNVAAVAWGQGALWPRLRWRWPGPQTPKGKRE